MGKMNRVSTKVWRISEHAPMGEWVDLSLPQRATRPNAPLQEEPQGAWVRSSYDLLDGIDINDDGAPVPDDVFDELFNNGNSTVRKSPN